MNDWLTNSLTDVHTLSLSQDLGNKQSHPYLSYFSPFQMKNKLP